MRQYFSLYRAVSQREGERGDRIDESKNVQTTPTRTYCKRNRPLTYCNQNCRTPRHWKFTQHHRTTRQPPAVMRPRLSNTRRGRCYTIGFRHPNFQWPPVDLASGIATAAGLPGIPRQAAYNREDRVRLVGSQDVRRRGIRVEDLELISRRALDDAKAAIAGKPVPRLLVSREWVFNTSFNYNFILRSRRPEVCPDVLYASPLLHRVRQLIYRRRPPQQVQSARYQYNSLRAFL